MRIVTRRCVRAIRRRQRRRAGNAALYALWHLFTATEMMSALRWGVGAVVLVQLSTLLRGFMGMQFEADRVLREIKRLELRLVRMEGRGEDGDV